MGGRGGSSAASTSSEGKVEGAADRKQQPVWVNAVIKALISSAKRECVIDHCRRQLRERQRLMDGWLCRGRPGRPAPPCAAGRARGAELRPRSPPPQTGRGALPLPRRWGGRRESRQLPAPRVVLSGLTRGARQEATPPEWGILTRPLLLSCPRSGYKRLHSAGTSQHVQPGRETQRASPQIQQTPPRHREQRRAGERGSDAAPRAPPAGTGGEQAAGEGETEVWWGGLCRRVKNFSSSQSSGGGRSTADGQQLHGLF